MGEVRDFLMPDLGEGLESGEIVAWNVEVGDHVDLNQEICDVETAKAVVGVPCPFAGTVTERFGEVGEELQVGEPLVRIDVEEVASGADVPDEVAEQLDGDAEPAGAGEATDAGGAPGDLDADEEPQPLVGYGQRGGRTRRRRGATKQKAPTGPGGDGQVSKPLAKPPVRKLAKDLDVELSAIMPGSGDGGIITRDDVRAAAQGPEPAPTEVSGREAAGVTAGFRGKAPGDVIPITGIKKRIVDKMTESRDKIPEATTSVTVDCTATWKLAQRLTEQAQEEGHDVRVSAFALVARATVLALRRFPTLNARLDEDAQEINLLDPIHLGIAVDTDRGLMVPNIKDAQTKTTLGLAGELTRLARAARDGSATPGELTGGTFTVNNYGYLGNDTGDPIINYPEAGILGVGAMNQRPWVVDGEVVVRRTVTLTIAFDHRVSDGGEAGRFVAYIGDLVEDPSRILLHA